MQNNFQCDSDSMRAYNNKRRYSLGNVVNTNMESKYSMLGTIPQGSSADLMFADRTNMNLEWAVGFSNGGGDSKLTAQKARSKGDESLYNLVKLGSMGGSELTDELNEPGYMYNQSSAYEPSSSISSSLSSLASGGGGGSQMLSQPNNKLPAGMRRRSFGPATSMLRPVMESRSASPVFNLDPGLFNEQRQQQQIMEQKLNLLLNSNYMSNQLNVCKPPPGLKNIRGQTGQSYLASTGHSSVLHSNENMPVMRPRAFSMGSGSFDATSTSSRDKGSALNSPPVADSRVQFTDKEEEKLATSGNIFERREDWLAILNKIPMSKQNSVHIRLEDEGPYGNDETRCFVLSHLSSLGIKRLSCVFCRCSLIVYDRFPLVDGTLFLSPLMYDAHTSIGAVVNNKQVYLNALCVECLLGLPETTSANNSSHQITCKHCNISLHSLGALSLQIGTLYKFDLFAAFPCCSRRFSCVQCQNVIPVDFDANNHFSFFSEERECLACKKRAHHFIKPIDDIYSRSKSTSQSAQKDTV